MVDEIRNKRLNYYNKLIETSRRQSLESDEPSADNYMSPIAPVNHQILETNIEDYPTNTMQFIDRLFNEHSTRKVNKINNLRQFSASLSFDEPVSQTSSSRLTSNRRLEEFKLVVESSYNQHVVNRKSETLLTEPQVFTERTDPPSPTNIFLDSASHKAESVASSIGKTF